MTVSLPMDPPLQVVSQINAEHAEVQRNVHAALDHAIRCGGLLYEVRRQFTGNWKGWLEDNFAGSTSTAQDYLQLWLAYQQDPGVFAELTAPTIRSALGVVGRRVGGSKASFDDDPDPVDPVEPGVPERRAEASHSANGDPVDTELRYALTLHQLYQFGKWFAATPAAESTASRWLSEHGIEAE